MTQEHLQTLIERAVEKANADNNAKNVIRTGVRYEPEQSPNILSGVIDIYEAPHRFRLSQTYDQFTRTAVYRFESDIDGSVRNIPIQPNGTYDTVAQDRLVDTMRDIIASKQLELCDIPMSPTQQMIVDAVDEMWDEYKQYHRNPNWVLEPHTTADPNKVQFQMRIDGFESTVTIARYAVHEEFPEGCLAIKSKSQPLELHSGHKGDQLDDIVMGYIVQEVESVFEDIVADMEAEEDEDDYELE